MGLSIKRRWKAARQAEQDDSDWIVKIVRPGERKRVQQVIWPIACWRMIRPPKRRRKKR